MTLGVFPPLLTAADAAGAVTTVTNPLATTCRVSLAAARAVAPLPPLRADPASKAPRVKCVSAQTAGEHRAAKASVEGEGRHRKKGVGMGGKGPAEPLRGHGAQRPDTAPGHSPGQLHRDVPASTGTPGRAPRSSQRQDKVFWLSCGEGLWAGCSRCVQPYPDQQLTGPGPPAEVGAWPRALPPTLHQLLPAHAEAPDPSCSPDSLQPFPFPRLSPIKSPPTLGPLSPHHQHLCHSPNSLLSPALPVVGSCRS